MDSAAEYIVRWHLAQHRISETEVDGLIDAMKRGLAWGEDDARQTLQGFIILAMQAKKTEPDSEIIPTMYALHQEFEALNDEEERIKTLVAIRDVIDNRVNTPLGDRIAQARIRAILDTIAN